MKFNSPLSIPIGKVGKFEIRHKTANPGETITVVSARDAIFSRKKTQEALVTMSFTIHQLFEGGSLWMTDSPQEQELHKDVVKKCKGNVLIGGLGLGYIAKMLSKKTSVEFVTVIEKEQDVIDLVWEHLGIENGVVIKMDLFDYLKKTKEKFDCAYYDIWAPTGEDILFTHVRPLKTLSKGIVPLNKIYCWEEQTMLGQMYFNFMVEVQTCGQDKMIGIMNLKDEQFKNFYRWSRTKWAYYNWYRTIKPEAKLAGIMAQNYVYTYTDEEQWGKFWDRWDYRGGNDGA